MFAGSPVMSPLGALMAGRSAHGATRCDFTREYTAGASPLAAARMSRATRGQALEPEPTDVLDRRGQRRRGLELDPQDPALARWSAITAVREVEAAVRTGRQRGRQVEALQQRLGRVARSDSDQPSGVVRLLER